MLATLGGTLALTVGVAVLLLPVLVSELSRPRDAAWGAVVLVLGLVLVTSADRLTGAPMLAVLCGGLLIGRLGGEVGQARWRQLTPEERQRLGTAERWRGSLLQLTSSLAGLATGAGGQLVRVRGGLARLTGGRDGASGPGRKAKASGKRWVRPEALGDRAAGASSGPEAEPPAAEAVPAEGSPTQEPPAPVLTVEEVPVEEVPVEEVAVEVVRDFTEIDALLASAQDPNPAEAG